MTKRKPFWDVLSDAQRQALVNKTIGFFQDEWDQRVGILAAEAVIDSVMESSFAAIYNQAVADSQKVVREKISDLNVDLDLLLKK